MGILEPEAKRRTSGYVRSSRNTHSDRNPLPKTMPELNTASRSFEMPVESYLRTPLVGDIHPTGKPEMADVEQDMVKAMLSRLPKHPIAVDSDDPAEVEYEGIPNLFARMKTQIRRSDERETKTLARTARRDEAGTDVRTEREKDIELAEEWHEHIKNGYERFLREYPAVGTKAWNRKKMEEARAARAQMAEERKQKEADKKKPKILRPKQSDAVSPILKTIELPVQATSHPIRHTTWITHSQKETEDDAVAYQPHNFPSTSSSRSGTEVDAEEAYLPQDVVMEGTETEETHQVGKSHLGNPNHPASEQAGSASPPSKHQISVHASPALESEEPATAHELAHAAGQLPVHVSDHQSTDSHIAPKAAPSSATIQSMAPNPFATNLSTRTYILRDYPHPTTSTTMPLLHRSLKRNEPASTAPTTRSGTANARTCAVEPVTGANGFVLAHPLPVFQIGVPAPDMLTIAYTINGREGVAYEAYDGDIPDWDKETDVQSCNDWVMRFLRRMGCYTARQEGARWLWVEEEALWHLTKEGLEGEELYREWNERWAGRRVYVRMDGVWRTITCPFRSEEAVARKVADFASGVFTAYGWGEDEDA